VKLTDHQNLASKAPPGLVVILFVHIRTSYLATRPGCKAMGKE
jgi:hypothetical protein